MTRPTQQTAPTKRPPRVIWTVAEITAGPTMSSYPGRAAPTGLRGRYIASMQTMFNLGAAVGPVLGVALYRAVGSAVWLCCAAGCAVGLALALAGMRLPAPVPHQKGIPS